MLPQRMSAGVSSRTSAARCILAMLLVACFADSITGSCLSYGHSCWGAHGKRSGKAPSSAPDWYLTRMLRRMVAANDLNRPRFVTGANGDDIYRVVESPNAPQSFADDRGSIREVVQNDADARPMLDESDISKMKIWQIMNAATEN